jgi:hypothetical protein
VSVVLSTPDTPLPTTAARPETPLPAGVAERPLPASVAGLETPLPSSVPQGEPVPEQPVELGVLEQAPPPAPHVRSGATPESVLATLKAEWPVELVQVETDPGKVQPVPELEDLLGLRAGRTRPALLPVSDEPLIQVETRRPESPPDDNRRAPESTTV